MHVLTHGHKILAKSNHVYIMFYNMLLNLLKCHAFSYCSKGSQGKKGNVKECSNYHTIALISHASKVMLKSSKLGVNNTRTENFQMYKLDFEKAEEPEIKLPTSIGS